MKQLSSVLGGILLTVSTFVSAAALSPPDELYASTVDNFYDGKLQEDLHKFEYEYPNPELSDQLIQLLNTYYKQCYDGQAKEAFCQSTMAKIDKVIQTPKSNPIIVAKILSNSKTCYENATTTGIVSCFSFKTEFYDKLIHHYESKLESVFKSKSYKALIQDSSIYQKRIELYNVAKNERINYSQAECKLYSTALLGGSGGNIYLTECLSEGTYHYLNTLSSVYQRILVELE